MIYILLKYLIHLFLHIIILKAFIFKASILCGTHTFLNNSLKVLQLPTHLSNLTANG